MTAHKFAPEVTNGGNVFADCTCGWSGGVYSYRAVAREAWIAHTSGLPIPEAGKVKPVILGSRQPRGMA